MGTNYYALVDVCDCCGRPSDKVHIGKSGRILRGYTEEQIEWEDAPGIPILTWADWKRWLRGERLSVIDEYGRMVEGGVEGLIAYFESASPEDRRRQYDAAIGHWALSESDRQLDPEGFSITFREFC